MDRPLIVNPPELPEPVGFAHAVVAGGTVYLGGQTGEGASLVEQFDSWGPGGRHQVPWKWDVVSVFDR